MYQGQVGDNNSKLPESQTEVSYTQLYSLGNDYVNLGPTFFLVLLALRHVATKPNFAKRG